MMGSSWDPDTDDMAAARRRSARALRGEIPTARSAEEEIMSRIDLVGVIFTLALFLAMAGFAHVDLWARVAQIVHGL